VDFFLIGAVAKDLWMTAINGIAPNRITRDIDFAVLVNDNGTYQSLKQYLIEHEGFQPVKDNAFVLLWKGRIQIGNAGHGIPPSPDRIEHPQD